MNYNKAALTIECYDIYQVPRPLRFSRSVEVLLANDMTVAIPRPLISAAWATLTRAATTRIQREIQVRNFIVYLFFFLVYTGGKKNERVVL